MEAEGPVLQPGGAACSGGEAWGCALSLFVLSPWRLLRSCSGQSGPGGSHFPGLKQILQIEDKKPTAFLTRVKSPF